MQHDDKNVDKPRLKSTNCTNVESSLEIQITTFIQTQSTIQMIQEHSHHDEKLKEATLYDQALSFYFADQQIRDQTHTEKKALNEKSYVFQDKSKKDYIRQYMKKKRESKSFRKQSNDIAQMGMKAIRETEQGKKQNAERAAHGKKRIRETSEGK